MKFKTLAIAAALVASAGANAAIDTTASGNSNVLFVAVDVNSNTSLVVDLGLSMSDFTNSNTAWINGGSFNFAANADWTAAYNTFKNAQAGGDFVWGVVASDSVNGGTIGGRGVLSTGNPTVAQMTTNTASRVANSVGNFGLFVAGHFSRGNHAAVTNGASNAVSTDGDAWLPNRMGVGNGFGGNLTFSSMLANGQTSAFQWIQATSATSTVTKQFGLITTTNTEAAAPLTFTFDIATDTLVMAAPIPEPQTYALMLAGLGAVGFLARRRRAA
jgi:PEP-CTERM motif